MVDIEISLGREFCGLGTTTKKGLSSWMLAHLTSRVSNTWRRSKNILKAGQVLAGADCPLGNLVPDRVEFKLNHQHFELTLETSR